MSFSNVSLIVVGRLSLHPVRRPSVTSSSGFHMFGVVDCVRFLFQIIFSSSFWKGFLFVKIDLLPTITCFKSCTNNKSLNKLIICMFNKYLCSITFFLFYSFVNNLNDNKMNLNELNINDFTDGEIALA